MPSTSQLQARVISAGQLNPYVSEEQGHGAEARPCPQHVGTPTALQTPVSSFHQHLYSSLPVSLVQGQGAEGLVPGHLALHLCGGEQVGG